MSTGRHRRRWRWPWRRDRDEHVGWSPAHLHVFVEHFDVELAADRVRRRALAGHST